jgi:hypothetical protein
MIDLLDMDPPKHVDPKRCACLGYYAEPNCPRKEVEVLLTNVAYHVHIINGLANVEIIQTFKNNTERFLNCNITFW